AFLGEFAWADIGGNGGNSGKNPPALQVLGSGQGSALIQNGGREIGEPFFGVVAKRDPFHVGSGGSASVEEKSVFSGNVSARIWKREVLRLQKIGEVFAPKRGEPGVFGLVV